MLSLTRPTKLRNTLVGRTKTLRAKASKVFPAATSIALPETPSLARLGWSNYDRQLSHCVGLRYR